MESLVPANHPWSEGGTSVGRTQEGETMTFSDLPEVRELLKPLHDILLDAEAAANADGSCWNDAYEAGARQMYDAADAILAALQKRCQEPEAERDAPRQQVADLKGIIGKQEQELCQAKSHILETEIDRDAALSERDLAIDMYGPKGEHDKTLAHIRAILEAHR
jgi:hypothetical protein